MNGARRARRRIPLHPAGSMFQTNQGSPAGQVSVSAYGKSSKNLKKIEGQQAREGGKTEVILHNFTECSECSAPSRRCLR